MTSTHPARPGLVCMGSSQINVGLKSLGRQGLHKQMLNEGGTKLCTKSSVQTVQRLSR